MSAERIPLPLNGLLDEPISPELVLVSPELAELARAQLPVTVPWEPSKRADGTAAMLEAPPTVEAVAPASIGMHHPWPARLAGAALLIAGGFLGAYLVGDHRERIATAGGSSTTIPARRIPTGKVLGPAAATRYQPPRVERPSSPAVAPLRHPSAVVPNVLGVVVTAGDGFVRLRWERPAGVERVAVLRVSGRRTKRRYVGRRTSFVDRSVRNGRTYRYVLLSYDRAGRSSTGVTTFIRPGPA